MRLVSLIVASIIILILIFTYLKATQKSLHENVNVPGTTDTRIEHTRKTVEEINKKIEEQKKAADELLER